jgi:hypothetical protein
VSSRRLLVGLALAVLGAGCAVAPAPSGQLATDPPSLATQPATASDGGAAVPGQPFAAADILAAMRDSQRPGGVPEELRTDAIASAAAELLWTFDGAPWTSITAGGSCGTDTCTLELAGAPDGAAGEDVWVLDVQPSTGTVMVASADLHGLPTDALEGLDRAARGAAGGDLPDDLLLAGARWLPPPDPGFVLAYRSGDEEGSCAADVVLDATATTVEDLTATGC